MSRTARTEPAGPLAIVRVAGALGAEIRGVQVSGDLEPDIVSSIRKAVMAHKVVFFRNQQHVDDTVQESFSALFGELLKHPNVEAAGGAKALLELTEGYSASVWHTDLTFIPNPAGFAILRPQVLPPFGGDTLWANAAAAYERLPLPLRHLADRLWAIHSSLFDFQGTFSDEYKAFMGEYLHKPPQHIFETEHPVVRVHPETGERALVLGCWVKRFLGLDNADSQKLFEIFQGHITRPENTVRWHWQAGDLAMWDNRSTQHRSVPDYGNEARKLRRATVLGEIPVAIDGRASRQMMS